jgi:hypothetical protein
MGSSAISVVLLKLGRDHIPLANQDDFNAQSPGGSNRTVNFRFGGVISAHCIQRNGQHLGRRLLLNNFDHFATLVLTAFGTYTVRQLGFVAIGTLGKSDRLQRIVRPALGRPRLGSVCVWDSAFLYLKFVIAERAPAVIAGGNAAAAFGLVPVLAADGADSLAGLPAHLLHRQGQQHLFPKDVLQFQAVAIVKPDLRFTLVDCDLYLMRHLRGGPVKQVEPGIQRKARATQTAVAPRRHFDGVTALNSNLTVGFFQQLGHTGCVQRGTLFDILAVKSIRPGSKVSSNEPFATPCL